MKQIPAVLLEHLQQDATTTCTLLKVTCKGAFAGLVLGLTSLDAPVVYDDGSGPLEYRPEHGFTPSAYQSNATLSVDNTEGEGVVDDAGVITERMVRAGLFNGADVVAYRVNYLNLAAGHEELFTARCGETVFGKTGWRTEFRGLIQQLRQTINLQYSQTCRAKFGDEKCGKAFTWTAGTVETATAYRGFTDSTLVEPAGGYALGVVEWLTGDNAGLQSEVYSFDAGAVELQLETAFPIQAGDTYRIRQDCDKSPAMCRDVHNNYNNANFRGESLTPIQVRNTGAAVTDVKTEDNNLTRTVFGVIGAIIGAYIGGPQGAQWGFQIGAAVGGAVDPVQVTGPRITEASTQSNSTAVNIPVCYGVTTVAGNLIELGDAQEHKHKEDNRKWYDPGGILSGGATVTTTYTYTRNFKIALCRGPIRGVLKIWQDGVLIYTQMEADNHVEGYWYALRGRGSTIDQFMVQAYADANPSAFASLLAEPNYDKGGAFAGWVRAQWPGHYLGNFGRKVCKYAAQDYQKTLDYSLAALDNVTVFTGGEDQEFYQLPDVEYDGFQPAYKGLAYVAFKDFDLTRQRGGVPQFEFLIDATKPDLIFTSPPYVVEDGDSEGISANLFLAELRNIVTKIDVAETESLTAALHSMELRNVVHETLYDEDAESISAGLYTATLQNVVRHHNQPNEDLQTITADVYSAQMQKLVIRHNQPNEDLQTITADVYSATMTQV